jgi:CBS domain-containing protein
MGEQRVKTQSPPEELRAFINHLLTDLRALGRMIADDRIESGVRRIGAEQELFLINAAWRPAPVALKVLDKIHDPHFTNEIALFNLEVNLDPITFGGDCLSRMERNLDDFISRARDAASGCDADVLLTGILPTIRKSDLELTNMTPKPRYAALNEALKAMRGGDYEFKIKGADELNINHETWMLEACCTSFQVHFQVGAGEFANLYNTAQAASAPVLAAAANSPLLFGRRLWKETRIPLFEQAIDTRNTGYHLRERSPRVSFGTRWVKETVLELFEEDISRFRVILGAEVTEDPFAMLARGLTPQLDALRIYNSTVWRWNRACYGVTEGRPHLRIEARPFPSGPTVVDEVANAAFFFGLMSGLSSEHRKIAEVMEFDDAKANFLAASQLGLDAQFTWIGGKVIPARELVCRELLPVAREGLDRAGVLAADADRYLGIIRERVESDRTGAQWLLGSLAELKKGRTKDEALTSLVATSVRQQQKGRPVHEWPLAQVSEEEAMSKPSYTFVEEFMTTDLFTVHEDEPVELVANLMDWKRVRHIPVEDERGGLVGLVSCFEVLRQLERNKVEEAATSLPVSAIMNREPLTVTPETKTLEAIALMRRERVDCLPVVKQSRLVGILTERDFIGVAARLLEQPPEHAGQKALAAKGR